MKPAIKYWIFLVTIVGAIFSVILGSFIGSWYSLDPSEQAFFDQVVHKLLPFPLLGALVLVAIVGTLISLLFHFYIIPILQLAEKTRLISVVNPDYRIEPRGSREVMALAGIINELAETVCRLHGEVDEKIGAARAELEEERTRLAALMSELPNGVLVCNTDGQILLYNNQAQSLLGGGEGAGGLVGLGRSVFGLLDRNPIAHALEMLHRAMKQGQAAPVSSFMTVLADGRCLRTAMAPVLSRQNEDRRISGFVLTLEDMTDQIEADARRDTLIQDLTDNLQEALTQIRQAISTILTDPQLRPDQLDGYRRIIDRSSLTLQERLGEARQNYARHLHALSKVEDVLAADLVEVLGKTLKERYSTIVKAATEEGLWLQLDSYSVVQAIAHLAGLLKSRTGITEIAIALQRIGGDRAIMSLGWPETGLGSSLVAEWRTAPLLTDNHGRTLSFADVVAGHGGDIAPRGEESCTGVEIDFPLCSSEARVEIEELPPTRPICYEFDLFHRPVSDEVISQPLRRLNYVVFDTETTGLNPSYGDEIIQIGAIRIINGRMLVEETYEQLVDPQRSVPAESVAIHGIEPALLQGKPTIDRVLPHFHSYVAGSILVAHNAAFDMRFLQLKEASSGVRFDQPVLDTLILSSLVHPNIKGHSLEDIARRLNVTIVGRHTALGDAIVTAEVLLKLIPLLESQGIGTLEQALAASSQSPFAKMKF